jgi:hypothetical protein
MERLSTGWGKRWGKAKGPAEEALASSPYCKVRQERGYTFREAPAAMFFGRGHLLQNSPGKLLPPPLRLQATLDLALPARLCGHQGGHGEKRAQSRAPRSDHHHSLQSRRAGTRPDDRLRPRSSPDMMRHLNADEAIHHLCDHPYLSRVWVFASKRRDRIARIECGLCGCRVGRHEETPIEPFSLIAMGASNSP